MCLETLVGTLDLMNDVIRQLDMEEGIFDFSITETIAKENMNKIFLHQELGIDIVHLYTR